jgi:hypothetical protein
MKKQATGRTNGTTPGRRMDASAHTVTPLRAQVLQAARRRCDDMHDSQAARDQMKREVLELPAELLPDLLTALSSVRIDRALLLASTPTPTNPSPNQPKE